jgi:two-component system nitrogen regulation response regulator NtrX
MNTLNTLLIIDDEEFILQSLSGALRDEGYQVHTADNGKKGLEMIATYRPVCIFLDIWMPYFDGLETLKAIKTHFQDSIVIMMSGHGNIETAVKATKLGAMDFLEKPLSLEKILVLLQNVVQMKALQRENQALRKQMHQSGMIVGKSKSIQNITKLINKVAPTKGSVLITGDNGTGKELVAKSLHGLSLRFNKPFVAVNCAAIPEELIESELFGHEKGSFTGATQMRRGKFDLASGGTLFLDEIGDMSLKTQAKILRILQEQKFERVGGVCTIEVDVRIIAATNKDLKEAIQLGHFREDLFYRLNVLPIYLPPLKDHKEDIPILAEHFLKEFCHLNGLPFKSLSSQALKALMSYDWPGNIRELKNLMERVLILSAGEDTEPIIQANEILQSLQIELCERNFEDDFLGKSLIKDLKGARQEFEKEFIVKALKENDGNISKTAYSLGIERTHLYRKMKLYAIK